ncbi:MAG: DUF429 domain-containing protein [Rhodospirillales bacterium]
MPLLAGVDGCRGGWLAVIGESPAQAQPRLFARWQDLPLADLACVAVDMPIGLADAGRRACDLAARARLPKGRKSSVFATPARPLLDQADYATANAWSKRRLGRGLAKQAWNLLPKIGELDRVMTPADQVKVFEAHPELAFARLSNGELLPAKRKFEGAAAREALLAAAGFVGLAAWGTLWPRSLVQRDDLLDAAVLFLTAQRIALGQAERLPAEAERDSRGLDMAIWF